VQAPSATYGSRNLELAAEHDVEKKARVCTVEVLADAGRVDLSAGDDVRELAAAEHAADLALGPLQQPARLDDGQADLGRDVHIAH